LVVTPYAEVIKARRTCASVQSPMFPGPSSSQFEWLYIYYIIYLYIYHYIYMYSIKHIICIIYNYIYIYTYIYILHNFKHSKHILFSCDGSMPKKKISPACAGASTTSGGSTWISATSWRMGWTSAEVFHGLCGHWFYFWDF
jgi:hypothetical protein